MELNAGFRSYLHGLPRVSASDQDALLLAAEAYRNYCSDAARDDRSPHSAQNYRERMTKMCLDSGKLQTICEALNYWAEYRNRCNPTVDESLSEYERPGIIGLNCSLSFIPAENVDIPTWQLSLLPLDNTHCKCDSAWLDACKQLTNFVPGFIEHIPQPAVSCVRRWLVSE